jgi:DNA-binding NarL/FixJ family response regulator
MSTDAQTIRVLIVDDHAVVRQGLRTFLELQDDPANLAIEVVGEAADGSQAVEQARRTQPDVVLLDLVMPVLGGIEALPRILEGSPRSRVIILTSFGEEDKLLPAIRAGAQGYLLKDIPPHELVQAVRSAYLGKVQLHPDIARTLMTAVAARDAAPATPVPPAAQAAASAGDLTEREREVLRLIAAGLNNRQIADKLVISEKTVKTHVSSILGKLGVEDRTQAAVYALRHGLAGKGE